MAGIVVGVDGSDHSSHALAWATREAAEHHAPLTVIAVHPAPVRPASSKVTHHAASPVVVVPVDR